MMIIIWASPHLLSHLLTSTHNNHFFSLIFNFLTSLWSPELSYIIIIYFIYFDFYFTRLYNRFSIYLAQDVHTFVSFCSVSFCAVLFPSAFPCSVLYWSVQFGSTLISTDLFCSACLCCFFCSWSSTKNVPNTVENRTLYCSDL